MSADGDGVSPAPARAAGSVLLVRRAAGVGCEVYVLHRAASMAFAGGMVAFPGGGREADDADARACAVRELAEETGVRLRPEDLLPWARWITPESRPIRYDTEFFVAALPAGQEPAGVTGEATHCEWVAPAAALAQIESGRWAALPPTRALLAELAEITDLADLPRQAGQRGIRHLLAPNPGPMTLAGTNTWLMPTGTGVVVVDPGPDEPEHFGRDPSCDCHPRPPHRAHRADPPPRRPQRSGSSTRGDGRGTGGGGKSVPVS